MAYEEKCNWFKTEPTNRLACGRLRNVDGEPGDFTINYLNNSITINVSWSKTLTRYSASGSMTLNIPKRVILWRLIGNLNEKIEPNNVNNLSRWKCIRIFDRYTDSSNNTTIDTSYIDTLPVVDDQSARDTYFQILKCRRALYYKVEYVDDYMSGFTCPFFVYADGPSVVALSTCRQIISNRPYDDCEQVWRYTNADGDIPFVRIVVDPLERRWTTLNGGSYQSKKKVVWATRANGEVFCLDYYSGALIGNIVAAEMNGNPLFAVALNPYTCELLYAANRSLYRIYLTDNGSIRNEVLQNGTDALPAWSEEGNGSRRTYTAQTGAACTVSPKNSALAKFYVVHENERVTIVPINASSGVSVVVGSKTTLDRKHFGCSSKTRSKQYNVYGITNSIDQAVWANGHTPLDYCYQYTREIDTRQVKISGLCRDKYVRPGMSWNNARSYARSLLGFAQGDIPGQYSAASDLLASALQGNSVPTPNYAICYRGDDATHESIYRDSCYIQNAHPKQWERYWSIMQHTGNWGGLGCKFGYRENCDEFGGLGYGALADSNRGHIDKKKGYKFNPWMNQIHQTETGKKEYIQEHADAPILQDIGYIYGCSDSTNHALQNDGDAFGGCVNRWFSNGQIEDESSATNDYRTQIRNSSNNGNTTGVAFRYFHPFTLNNSSLRRGWWGDCPKTNTLNGDVYPSDHWVYKPYLDRDSSVPQSSWDLPMSQLGIGTSLPPDGCLVGNLIGISNSIKDDYYIYQTDYQENTVHKIIINNGSNSRNGIEPLLSAQSTGNNEFTLGSFYAGSNGSTPGYVSRPTHVISDDFNCVWVITQNSVYRFYPSTLANMTYPSITYQTTSGSDGLGFIYSPGEYNGAGASRYFMYGLHGNNYVDCEFALLRKWQVNGVKPEVMTIEEASDYCANSITLDASFKLFPDLGTNYLFYYATQSQSNNNMANLPYCYRREVVSYKANGDAPQFNNTDAHVTYNEYNSDNLGIHALVALGETSVSEIIHPAYRLPSVSIRIINAKHTNPVECDNPDPECNADGTVCVAKWSGIVYADESNEPFDPLSASPLDNIALNVRGYDYLATEHLLEFINIENFDIGKVFLDATGKEVPRTITYSEERNIPDDATYGSLDMWLPDDIFWKEPNVLGGVLPLSARQVTANSEKTVGGGIEVSTNVYQIATQLAFSVISAPQKNNIYLYERWSEPAYCINGFDSGLYGYDDVLEQMWNCSNKNQ